MANLRFLKKKGFKYICGVDEAGRGPLAGPLSLSFFIITIDEHDKILGRLRKLGLNDSKKLSEVKREELFVHIRCVHRMSTQDVRFHNSMISAPQIDRYGISRCMQILIKRLLQKTKISKTYFLLDGAIKFPEHISHEVIIKGDTKEPTIMAASITAKVLRDKKMKQMSLKFPEYSFDVHKGYGTLEHRKAIKKFGMSKEHRKYFCKNI